MSVTSGVLGYVLCLFVFCFCFCPETYITIITLSHTNLEYQARHVNKTVITSKCYSLTEQRFITHTSDLNQATLMASSSPCSDSRIQADSTRGLHSYHQRGRDSVKWHIFKYFGLDVTHIVLLMLHWLKLVMCFLCQEKTNIVGNIHFHRIVFGCLWMKVLTNTETFFQVNYK